MNIERIAEIADVTDRMRKGVPPRDVAEHQNIIEWLGEYAALLRAGEGDEPDTSSHIGDEFVDVLASVSKEAYDWQRAGRLLALAENEQLKAQLVEAQQDEERLIAIPVVLGVDGFGDIDIHELAFECAEKDGEPVALGHHYLRAVRAAIDAERAKG